MKFSIKDWKQCNHENNVPSCLSPQWLCYNSNTWAHDVSNRTLCVYHVPTCTHNRTSSAQVRELPPSHWSAVHELPPSHCSDNWDSTLFSLLHIYYPHLASVRFKHFMCCGSLLTTFHHIYILYICYILCCYYDECVRQVYHHLPIRNLNQGKGL